MAGGIALVRQALSDQATAQEIAETVAATSPIVADANGNSAPRMDLYLTYEDMSALGSGLPIWLLYKATQ
jgi:hypothetical protein